jgi:hypothetical protein
MDGFGLLMPLGVAIALTVLLTAGVAVMAYASVRVLLAWKRGQLRMTAFNTLTGRWSDEPDPADHNPES